VCVCKYLSAGSTALLVTRDISLGRPTYARGFLGRGVLLLCLSATTLGYNNSSTTVNSLRKIFTALVSAAAIPSQHRMYRVGRGYGKPDCVDVLV